MAVVTLIGCVRVVSMYRVFNQVVDEPAHIAAGMQLLSTGQYALDPTHPPLPRILVALGPYLDGIRYQYLSGPVGDGDLILYARERYLHNLTRARLGTLPFFIVAILVVAAWTRALAGEAAAIAAAALFSNEPNVLAHAGLATTDMAATASTIAAAYIFWRWLCGTGSQPVRSQPVRSDVPPGVAIAVALLCKFSAILFLPAAMAGIILVERRLPPRALRSFAIAAAVAIVLVWAGYHFTFSTPAEAGAAGAFKQAGAPWTGLIDWRMPAPELLHGLLAIRMHSLTGHAAYALGRWSPKGWWWYFPLAIAVKTTIGFLLLLFAAARRETLAPFAAGMAILLVSLPVSINIGVRHILPVYPFFAVAAGAALVAIWRKHRVVAGLLAAAAIVPSVHAHPDYIPYFNAFAGPRPDNILLDSNLDWGQDLLRLEREAKRRNIADRLSLAYSGTAQPDHHGLDITRLVDPLRYTPGWLAVSEMLIHDQGPAYRWLDLFQPVARVGKSIRLYYVPSPEELRGRSAIVPDSVTSSTFDRVLLPVWFSGTAQGGGTGAWQCDLVVRNDSAREVPIRTRPDADAVVRVAPYATLTNPPLALGYAKNGALLYVPRDDAGALHFNLHLHPPDAAGIVIPVVPARMASSSALHFLDVPMDDDSRATVRVYDLSGEASTATLRMFALDGGATAVKVIDLEAENPRATFPPAAEVNLAATFPEMRRHRVRLEIDPPSAQFWAFVSVTRFPAKNMYTMLPE